MGWARRFTTGLLGQSPEPASRLCHSASIPRADEIAPTSPACILAKSLTDPETRGEWVREHGVGTTKYRNKLRDITLTHHLRFTPYNAYDALSTPFTLSKDEEKVLWAAIAAFDKREADERERDALARLTAKPAPRKT